MPAPTTTPAADLLIALHPHNAEFAAANEAMDFALSRALDEQQIGYLEDVVSAAETLVAGQILVTIRVENTYATGQGFVHQLAVAAPMPPILTSGRPSTCSSSPATGPNTRRPRVCTRSR